MGGNISFSGQKPVLKNNNNTTEAENKKLFRPLNLSARGLLIILCVASILLLITQFGFFEHRPRTFKEKLLALNLGHFKDAGTGGALSSQEVQEKFVRPIEEAQNYKNENKELERMVKFSTYSGTYSYLVGQYYATRDEEILKQAKELLEFIKNSFPKEYQSAEKNVPEYWLIRE